MFKKYISSTIKECFTFHKDMIIKANFLSWNNKLQQQRLLLLCIHISYLSIWGFGLIQFGILHLIFIYRTTVGISRSIVFFWHLFLHSLNLSQKDCVLKPWYVTEIFHSIYGIGDCFLLYTGDCILWTVITLNVVYFSICQCMYIM